MQRTEWRNWNVPAYKMRVRPNADNNRFFEQLAKVIEGKQLEWLHPVYQDGEFIWYEGHSREWQLAVVEAASAAGMSVEGWYKDKRYDQSFSIFL